MVTRFQRKMEHTFHLQEHILDADSDDEFAYNEVPVSECGESSYGEEDLDTAVQNGRAALEPKTETQVSLHKNHVEVVEDFVRNFLVSNKLLETAEVFQREWYQRMQCGQLKTHQKHTLPDVYSQNRQLEGALTETIAQLEHYKEAAKVAKERYVRIQKERDYHRMHHRRVVQEKTKLVSEVKRMKTHYSTYEPVLQQLQHKYQAVTREKMLACLERDRAVSEVGCLQTTLQSVQRGKTSNEPKVKPQNTQPELNIGGVPHEPANPYRGSQQPLCAHLTRTAGFQPSTVLSAHDYPVSCVTPHPSKPFLITGSDDHTWKMWSISSKELVMSGQGHNNWISSVQCAPNGSMLATTSGDGTIKLWSFDNAFCVSTFREHQQPVWDCCWHWDGVLLASGAMDHTAKIWDTQQGVCVSTLRGHADSVNALSFMTYSNTLLTTSADKTVSMWDLRTGLCSQTFYGHLNSCNDVTPTLQGYEVYSCDCFGGLMQWDMRCKIVGKSWELGPYSLNSATVDPAGALVCCASDDGSVRIVDTNSDKEWVLDGEYPVLDAVLNKQADTLFSTNSEGQLIYWE